MNDVCVICQLPKNLCSCEVTYQASIGLESYVDNLRWWKIHVETKDVGVSMKDLQNWLYNLTKVLLHLYDSQESTPEATEK